VNLTGAKLAMAKAIETIVKAWTNGDGDARPFISIAQRESNFVPTATGDVEVAKKVWTRVKPQYERQDNPFTGLDGAWSASRGLYQLMVPYQLWRWDWRAHPLALENPVVATVVAGRIFNAAQRLGAKTPVDVRMVWAFGGDGLQIPHDDERYIERLTREQDRMEKLGFPRSLALASLPGLGLSAFGVDAQSGQDGKALALTQSLGFSTWPGADDTTVPTDDPKPSMDGSGILPLVAIGALIWGMRHG